MKQRHLFVLDPGIWRAASVHEIEATCDALKKMKLYRLPYEHSVYVRLRAYDIVTFDDKRAPDDPRVVVDIGPLDSLDCRAVVHNFHTGFSENLGSEHMRSQTAVSFAIRAAKDLLITLLATRNAVKTTKENKLSKLGIGSPAKRRYAYTTTISVPAIMEDDPDSHPGANKAPHLRRGHIRGQHYGPGNQYVKQIFVEAVFVNADADFVNAREAYNVSLGKQPHAQPPTS